MDRRYRNLAGCGLALALALGAGSGCKSTRSEVPPSPSFTGNAQGPVGFGQDPNPANGAAGMPGAGTSQYGTPSPSSTPSYGPTGNGGFGAPGTNLGTQSVLPPSAAPGSPGLSSPLGATNPAPGASQGSQRSSDPAANMGRAPTPNPFDN